MTPSLSTDDLFAALADRYRRQILAYLIEHDSATVEELRSRLTSGNTSRSIPGDLIATQLYHSYLPYLDDVGFVRYDRDANTVEATDVTDETVAALLTIVPETEASRSTIPAYSSPIRE